MDVETLLEELKTSFGLTDKQAIILKALQKWPLTSEQISKQTQIPQGRVYSYLNTLIELKLIEKTSRKPFFYEVKDLNKSVVNFIKHHSDKVITAKTRVLDLLQKSQSKEHMELVDSREKYSLLHLDMITESTSMKIIAPHGSFPFLLYPQVWEDFLATRNAVKKYRPTITLSDYSSVYLTYKTYREAAEHNKNISVIMEQSAWDDMMHMIKKEFGDLYLKHYLKELRLRFKQGNLSVFLSKEYQPIEVDINEQRVGVALRYADVTTGIMIQSESAVAVFDTLFGETRKRSISLKEILTKKLPLLEQTITDKAKPISKAP